MINSNIKITGTSFLLPKNKAWESLGLNFNISFSDYGDISGALLNSNNNDILLIIVFFEDIVNETHIEIENIDSKFNHLFEAINFRCKNSKVPTILCFGNVYSLNVIRFSKFDPEELSVYNFFINKFNYLKINFNSFYFLELNKINYEQAEINMYDDRNWYYAHCRLSTNGIKYISNSVEKILFRYFNSASKVLVLDCDNTLWGGVVGEDGIDGIVLGQDGLGNAFVDFQKQIKKLVKEGLIITLSSKNNENDVWDVFLNHSSMVLTKEDIVTWRINWDEKYENIKSISNELDLDLNSFVFWDDNPIEREKIKTNLPQVSTIDMPHEVYKWPRLIKNLDNFSKFEITNDDKNKNKQYHGRAIFKREISNNSNIFNYLKGLNLQPSSFNLNKSLITRAVQLSSKTNQYNFRTVRYNADDLLRLHSNNDDFVFLVNLIDNHGDHGIVAMVCLEEINSEYLFIHNFIMSCRILGRYLEAWILNEIILRAKLHGFSHIIGEFIPSNRNQVANNFFNYYGFDTINHNPDFVTNAFNKLMLSKDGIIYSLTISDLLIKHLDLYEKN